MNLKDFAGNSSAEKWYIETLNNFISTTHDCSCTHLETEWALQKYQDQVIWEGKLEVFQVEHHTEAKFAYGWGWKDDDGTIKFAVVLRPERYESPNSAVWDAIKSGQFT